MCDSTDSDNLPALFWGLGVSVPTTVVIASIYGPDEFFTAIEVGGVTFVVVFVGYFVATKGLGGAVAGGAVDVIKGLVCGIINEI